MGVELRWIRDRHDTCHGFKGRLQVRHVRRARYGLGALR